MLDNILKLITTISSIILPAITFSLNSKEKLSTQKNENEDKFVNDTLLPLYQYLLEVNRNPKRDFKEIHDHIYNELTTKTINIPSNFLHELNSKLYHLNTNREKWIYYLDLFMLVEKYYFASTVNYNSFKPSFYRYLNAYSNFNGSRIYLIASGASIILFFISLLCKERQFGLLMFIYSVIYLIMTKIDNYKLANAIKQNERNTNLVLFKLDTVELLFTYDEITELVTQKKQYPYTIA